MPNVDQKSERFRIPDTLVEWPWQREINPLYEEVKAESSAWVESFHAFDGKTQKAFNACDFKRLRTCADVMNFAFAFDAYSDAEDENGVQAQRDIIMDALRNPNKPRPSGECLLGEMARQMWARAIQTASHHAQVRFVETMDVYTTAVVQEAEDRRLGKIRGIEDYLTVRRGTAGAYPFFALLELDTDIDENLLNHEAVLELERLAVDFIILGNDMVSYIVERDTGHRVHNIVTNVMHEMHSDIHGAMHWIEMRHASLVERYMKTMKRVPLAGPELERYVWGVGNWVRAIDCWYFESERYFGKHGLQIQKERWVDLHFCRE
ncbi:hypothetical protein SERLA73DRAFT_61540 [Serpula lacrymans var. lacrymans S7.3]|uniref:Terpene synthase n=1 Tax=Serpula lacrymans var. lacrymans (strain S7.3) TaxID=936435 RepID=F8Q8Z0_SERL3|nr:hypothetical protein SERLA73DRAFT_61540 [Serpula lacrymans var. lacrymans S7.3]